MGHDPGIYWRITPRETILSIEGYYNRIEREQRQQWERERWSTSVLIQPHAKKGAINKPQDLMLFPWEKEIKKNTKEDIQRLLNRVADRYKISPTKTLTDGSIIRGVTGKNSG